MTAKKKPAGAHVLLDRKITAVLPFTSRDATRPVLGAVKITPTHAYATDRYKLVRIDLDESHADDYPQIGGEPATSEIPPEGVYVPAGAIRRALAALKSLGPSSALPILNRIAVKASESEVRLTCTDLDRTTVEAARAVMSPGGGPDHEALLEKVGEPESTVYLDAQFLHDIAAAVVTFNAHKERARIHAHAVIKLELFGQTKMIRFSTDCDGRQMVGLLMPVRPGDGW